MDPVEPTNGTSNISSLVNNSNNAILGTLQTLEVYYWEQILVAIFMALIAIAGLIGNSMIILAVSFSRKLQTSTNAFVVNLSIADLTTSFFLIFYTIGALGKEEWPIPEAYWICELTAFVMYTCTGTSLYNLAAIGLNRLILISQPKIYPHIFRSWKLAICLAIPWLVPAVGFFFAQYSGLGKLGYDPLDRACALIDAEEKNVGLSLVIILIGFPIPLVVILVTYTWIYIIVKKHNNKMTRTDKKHHGQDTTLSPVGKQNMSQAHSVESVLDSVNISTTDGKQHGQDTASSPIGKQEISRKQIKITRNLFMILCSFFICFSPYFILFYIPNVYHVFFYTRVITLSNSAVNFAIYAYKHPEFKIVLRHLMTCSYQNIPQPTKLLKKLLTFRSARP